MSRSTLLALLALSPALLVGCGVTRTGARDEAARETCDYYARCGEVGEGKTYASRDACEVRWTATFEDVFSAANCEERVSGEMLDACVNSIRTARCENGLDFLAAASRCNADSICVGD
jgi:hypothetical protein